MHVPSATYRLQFSKQFRFADAQALVPLLHRLGISHIYASPIFQARAGSEHGYDVTNPARLNPELGSREEFNSFTAALQHHGMGLVLDIVPNHMAVSEENEWWVDVLENGTGSPYSGFFGVDWGPDFTMAEMDQIYLPILGDPFWRVLEWGHLKVGFNERGFFVSYYAHHLPLDPATYNVVLNGSDAPVLDDEQSAEWQRILETIRLLPRRVATKWELVEGRLRAKEELKQRLWDMYQRVPAVKEYIDRRVSALNVPAGPECDSPLEQLLSLQPYRLAYWRVAREKINYRRFFDVTDLIGIRAEMPNVFAATHALALELVAQGHATGLRVDHIDGLVHPREYLERLRAAAGPDTYLVVEKITLGNEELPRPWPVQGTTGYDFLAAVNGAFAHQPGLAELDRFYREFTGCDEDFAAFCYRNKKLVMEELFRGEVLHLGDVLVTLSEMDRRARDISPDSLRSALREVTACLPVYRTYTESFEVSARDLGVVRRAMDCARAHRPDLSESLEFVERVLRLRCPPSLDQTQRDTWLRFVRRWQQLTGPIMAKGVEDTTFYQYNRLLSLNEVGGDLQPLSIAEFHERMRLRREYWPHTMNASATHDTKRGEDVRARLNVLAELSAEWTALVQHWHKLNEPRQVQGIPAPNEEYFLYQILAGAWPLCDTDVPQFQERLTAYLQKASREAKSQSSWFHPNEQFEKSLQQFAQQLVQAGNADEFGRQFREFVQRVSYYGALNSLSQLLLKATCPGVPDFYQGTGMWDLSLVDPDNRRPVDYGRREHELHEALTHRSVEDLIERWDDGAIKLFLTYKLLQFRASQKQLFLDGSYEPLTITGERADNLIAFARRTDSDWILVLAPRFFSQLSNGGRQTPLGSDAWRDTKLTLPAGAPKSWRNVITGESLQVQQAPTLTVSEAMQRFPVALWHAPAATH